ncbi:MAG: histidinol-phosphate transaminase [Wolinella sp.]
MQFSSTLDSLKVYEAGKPIELVVREYGINPDDVIKLASNENPFGTPPNVVEAIKACAHNAYRYPDDSMFELKEGLATRFGIKSENIIIGQGSDQVIEMAVHAKCNKESSVLMAGITFAMYEIYARQTGAKIIRTKSQKHDLNEFLEIYKRENPSVIFLCLPNNPLGESLDTSDVYRFLEKIDSNTLVMVDGAYQEYAAFKDSKKAIDASDLIARFPNTIYLGTFSKAYGLGGMRVGYGIAEANIIRTLHKVRAPFNITTPSLAGAIAALNELEFVKSSIKDNFKEMARYEAFARDFGLEFIPSFTNFITILLGEYADSSELSEWLLRRGLIIRNLKSYGLNAIRITIGTETQNSRALTLVKEFLDKQK